MKLHRGQKHSAVIKYGAILECAVLLQNRDIVKVSFLIENERVHGKQKGKILRKLRQTCVFRYRIGKIEKSFPIARHFCQNVTHFSASILCENLMHRDNRPSDIRIRQEISAGAADPLRAMNTQPLHPIPYKRKRRIRLDIAVVQKSGRDRFRQCLIAKLIDLVIATCFPVVPLFLLAAR